MKKRLLTISIILNIILIVLLNLVLNTTYKADCGSFTSEQKIIDYIIGRDQERGVKMFELTITRIKYPKNDTKIYEYESLDNLLMELKQMIIDKKVNKDDIIRIRGVRNER